MTRSRTARCLGALIGAAALLGALPAPAQAERRHDRRHHDDRGDRGRGHRYDDDRRHHHGRDCDHGRYQVYYAPRYYAPPRWVRAGYYRDHAPAYTCGRCRTHFGSYDGLYGHVHAYHRVPMWQVPSVLAQVSFGWTFGF